jgi:hypothetical protein
VPQADPSTRADRQSTAHPDSARADQLELWTDNLCNDRLNCVEGRTQGTLDVVALG